MNRPFYTMLIATILALPCGYATADSLIDGFGTAVTGQVGTSTPISGDTYGRVSPDVDTSYEQSPISPPEAEMAVEPPVETYESAAIKAPYEAPVYTSEGLDEVVVRNIQQSLNERGFNVGRVDGHWNQRTAAKLNRYETSLEIPLSSYTSPNAETLQHLGVDANDSNPAAGAGANISHAAHSMGAIQRVSSHND